MSVDADTFIPEFWPADKILGLILDEQLEGISAGKIVGQIVNAQVASLAAAKIEGKLTQKQIESIAAEQITGKLTNEQIAEIAAAKIVGQLTDAQLGGISAAKIIGEIASGQISSLSALKITGQLTNAQIEALEAAKITGQLTSAQIKSIEAAKVTGQITNAQLAGLAAAKVEGLLTSEQIENLAVAKLVGQISESQIAAKAITAGKINVAELSAISAKAGLIEAGTFRGVIFETTDGHTVMNNNGFGIIAPKIGSSGKTNRIEWFKEKLTGTLLAEIVTYLSESEGTAFMQSAVNSPAENASCVNSMIAGGNVGEIRVIEEVTKALRKLYVEVKDSVNTRIKTLLDSEGRSDFVQLPLLGKVILNRGQTTVEFPGENVASNFTVVKHELGSEPVGLSGALLEEHGAEAEFRAIGKETFEIRLVTVTGLKPAKGTKWKLSWIATT